MKLSILIFLSITISIVAGEIIITHENVVQLADEFYGKYRLESSKKEIEKLIYKEKIREYLPKVGVSYFGLKNKNENQSDNRFDEYRLTLQQLLYDGGDNFRQKDLLMLSAKMEDEDRKLRAKRYKLQAFRNYLFCITNRYKKYLNLKIKERSEFNYKIVIKENSLNLKRKIDALEYAIRLEEANSNLSKTLLLIEESDSELLKLLGIEESTPIFSENILSDFIILPPPEENSEIVDNPEINRAKITLDKSKTELEIAQNHWKPKLFAGGYYGKNSTDALDTRHTNYGLDFSVVLPLGSSTAQSSGRYGIQEDGNGIQRIPGFGPQYVGQGENSYNSGNFQLFDNMSYSRKILEGEVKTLDAKKNLHEVLLKAEAEKIKNSNRVKISFKTYKNNILKSLYRIEQLRHSSLLFKSGLISRLEYSNSEFEVFKSLIELSESITDYLLNSFEYSILFTGTDINQYFYYRKQGAHLEIKKFLEDIGYE